MKLVSNFSLKAKSILPDLVEDYLYNFDKIAGLWPHPPSINAIHSCIKAKESFAYRDVLTDILIEQYSFLELDDDYMEPLEQLRSKTTFTICTAHQLCLFTGPSYFIYKIMSAISLCKILKKKYPKYNFLPVYWMGSEDHDFDEINHCKVYNTMLKWQRDAEGACGRLSLKHYKNCIDEFDKVLGGKETAKKFTKSIRTSISANFTYGNHFQKWILSLFKEYGLIVINSDDVKLKKCITPLIKSEIEDQFCKKETKKPESFIEKNYTVQAKTRDINLFYLTDSNRNRIVKENNSYRVLNKEISFSKEEINKELTNHPERFSPNVILRPLYQESVLPNVAFIGGSGELSYWLQLSNCFSKASIPHPVLLLRDMAFFIKEKHLKQLNKMNIEINEILTDFDSLAKKVVFDESNIPLNLKEQKQEINTLFKKLKERVKKIDINLEKSVQAELQKVLNSLINLEGKMIRAEKKKHDTLLQQLQNIQSKIVPSNTLQERIDNFTPYYLSDTVHYFKLLEESFNPLLPSMKAFEY